ncbi:MAG: hypothetical protein ABIS50_20065 [Luteolibacter sp.]|uniref:hypothetical protein n=1 Tax=Luteolibacter sp. TaxID=1962973 RepID=UPI0032679F9F
MKLIVDRCGWFALGGAVGGALLVSAGAARGDWPVVDRDIQADVIALDGKDSVAEVVRQDMGNTAGVAQPIRPDRGIVPELATKDRGYVLCGDLFKTGGFSVLYEPKIGDKPGLPTLALAEFGNENQWELRGLWKTQIDWVSEDKRCAGTGESYFPKETPHRPFILEDVVGDATPEVILAGAVLKYHQLSYLLKYDEKTHGLALLAQSMAKPVKVGKNVRLYQCSGNKATWQEWTFLGWEEDQLVERGAWYSEVPYNDEEPPFAKVTLPGKDGKREEYRINRVAANGPDERLIEVLKDGKPFAKVQVTWAHGKGGEAPELMEDAWIFERLTGLAREYFPERHAPEAAEKPKLDRLEDNAAVDVVEGAENEEVRRLFSEKK